MIVVLMMILLIGCNSASHSQYELSDVKNFNQNEILNPIITIIRGDIPVVKAKSIKLTKNENSDAILKGLVKATFFDDSGVHISNLYSDSAYIDQKTNNLRAYGNVKVISNDSVKLFSNSILWDNRYELITSTDSVMFTTHNQDTMYGVGFESDMDLTDWRIKKPHGVRSAGAR